MSEQKARATNSKQFNATKCHEHYREDGSPVSGQSSNRTCRDTELSLSLSLSPLALSSLNPGQEARNLVESDTAEDGGVWELPINSLLSAASSIKRLDNKCAASTMRLRRTLPGRELENRWRN